MGFCPCCGKEINSGSNFCPDCGANLTEYGNNQRKQVFEGNIHKCPNCGEVVAAFSVKCPTCGFEFRNVNSTTSVKVFADEIARLQKERKKEEIVSYIKNYSIPNTKEDILEFMILASANIDTDALSQKTNLSSEEKYRVMVSDAWFAKMEQAYQKALISFGGDPIFNRIQETYDSKVKEIKDKKEKRKKTLIFALGGYFIFGLIFIIVGGIFFIIMLILLFALGIYSNQVNPVSGNSAVSTAVTELVAVSDEGFDKNISEPSKKDFFKVEFKNICFIDKDSTEYLLIEDGDTFEMYFDTKDSISMCGSEEMEIQLL